jgi:hypothetical protein
MANVTVKFDENGEMEKAVEILKTMGIPVRKIMRDALIKEAARWAHIANEVNAQTKGTTGEKR